jgi:acylpyruvate hydrolase
MRFVSFKRGEKIGLAIAQDGRLLGLTSDDASYPGDLATLITSGEQGMRRAYDRLAHESELDGDAISYLPVLSSPPKILCVGLNYRDHTAESGFQQPTYPTIFARFSTSLTAHEQSLIKPRISDTLDFEGELAVIIGRRGRRISEADALDFVAGYSIFNDGSVREYQHKSPQWTVGKNFDATGSFGPEFVSKDELPPGASGLKIETRLNGETVQSSNTAQMVFNTSKLIAIISEAMTLEPGDVIVSGTPSGVGHARKPSLYMKHGDICEVEIEGVGVLRNTITDESAVDAAA